MAAAQVARMRTDSVSPSQNQNQGLTIPLRNQNNNSRNSNNSNNNSLTTIMTSPHNLEGITSLMVACQQGRTTDVRTILKKKTDVVRDRTRSEKVALHFCAEGGSVDCLEAVLEADKSLINAQDEEGYSPLHLAVINGNKDIVKAFISAKADLNSLDNEKHSLVHWATVCGELEILDILLTRGAPATTPDIHLAHPIHYAAQMCGNVNGLNSDARLRVQSTLYGVSPKKGLLILRRLIQHGVPIDVRDQDGRQPLLWAASAGSADAILSLVNAGAFVEAEDKDGLTALHCAASRGHTDCLETLIALCGAEVDVIDKNGCTALFYAITLGHADCTEFLLNYGAEPNRQDRKGRTPAHCGASKGQLETIKLFAKHEGNLWMRNVRGDLPLHEAVISRRKDLVTWLLSQRPDTVNASNNDGRCPIHLAALNNNVEMVKILIDHHADVNPLMRTGKGVAMTPLDAAIHRGNSAVAKFLQLHGGLPANSLNDAALQRRLNRSLDSQARSGSSMHGSQMGCHHEHSPDNETRMNFTPEVLETSVVRQYAHNLSGTLITETSRMVTSTPIMQGSGSQTDSRHYLRDMEVQVSEDFPDMEYRTVTESVNNLSAQSKNKSEKKLRRKRSSREKSNTAGVDSTDSDTVKQELTLSRSSRRSRSRKSSDSSPTLKKVDSPGTKTTSDETTNGVAAENNDKVAENIDRDRTSSQNSSDNFHNESEKFSELENVAVASSECEIRDEELEVIVEVHSRAESRNVTAAGNKSVSPDKISRKQSAKSGRQIDSVSPAKSRALSRGRASTRSSVAAHETPIADLSGEEASRSASPDKPTGKASSREQSGRDRKSVSSNKVRTPTPAASEKNVGRTSRTPSGHKSATKSRTPSGRAKSGDKRDVHSSTSRASASATSDKQSRTPAKADSPETGRTSRQHSGQRSSAKSRTPSARAKSREQRETRSSRSRSATSARKSRTPAQADSPEHKSSTLAQADSPEHESKTPSRKMSSAEADKKSRQGSASAPLPKSRTTSRKTSAQSRKSSGHRYRSPEELPSDAVTDKSPKSKPSSAKARDKSVEETQDSSTEDTATIVEVEDTPKIVEIEYMEVRSENTRGRKSGSDISEITRNSDDNDKERESDVINEEAKPKSEDTEENPEESGTTTGSSETQPTGDGTGESSAENAVDLENTYIEPNMAVLRSRPSVPFSEQSSESKDSETFTQSSNSENKSDDTADDIIYENQLGQLSLQEAAEARRRRKAKSKTESPLPKRSVKRKPPPPKNPNYLRTPKTQSPKGVTTATSPKEGQSSRNKSVSKKDHSPSPPKKDHSPSPPKKDHSPSPPRETVAAKPSKIPPKRQTPKPKPQKIPVGLTKFEEEEIRLQEELMAALSKAKRGNGITSDLTKPSSRSKIPTSKGYNKTRPVPVQPSEFISNHVDLAVAGPKDIHLLGSSARQRNPSESNRSNQSDDLGRSNRDSGYSDRVIPTTSASEDQSRLKMMSKSGTGSIRRRVLSKRPKSSASVALKKSGALSSGNKVPKTSRDTRTRFETTLAHRQGVLSQGNGSEDTTSQAGSGTSDDDDQTRQSKRRNARPRSKLTFTKGEDIRNSSARLSPQARKPVDIATPISVTQAMQASMRKYHLERKIFQELLELKRLQIRAGKANEQILVKRLSDGYKKAGLSINFRDYDGPYTFRNFEKYLYDQLRLLQANRRILPRFAPSDDLEKLSTALKKMNATKLPFLEDPERCESHGDHSQCTSSTHRCHHAAHAYTGVPCAAYIGKGRRTGFLPKVDPLKAPGPTQNDPLTRNIIMNGTPGMKMIVSPRGESDSPITLEVQQGTKTQVYALPSQSLDPTKNYYVSLSIRPTPSPPPGLPNENLKNAAPPTSNENDPDTSGQLSAPPPPLPSDADITSSTIDINNSDKLNQSF